MKVVSPVRLSATPGAVARQAPLSLGFSGPEHCSGWLFSSPGDLPNPGIERRSPAWQADSLPSEPAGRPSSGKPSWRESHISQFPLWQYKFCCMQAKTIERKFADITLKEKETAERPFVLFFSSPSSSVHVIGGTSASPVGRELLTDGWSKQSPGDWSRLCAVPTPDLPSSGVL